MGLMSIAGRKRIIDEINSTENKQRKSESYKQSEIYSDRIFQYVYERLMEHNNASTVREIPIISSVNLARRIVKEEASIYKESPDRNFSDLSDKQQESIDKIYDDMKADSKLMRSNELYKLQSQSMMKIIPKNGKIVCKNLKMHHFDVIPSANDPEEAMAVVISGFDRTQLVENFKDRTATGYQGPSTTNRSSNTDGVNQKTADPDDHLATLARMEWWSKEFHFITNGRGEIIDENGKVLNLIVEGGDLSNPIGMLPFVDIAINKDFEYFVREGSMITDFTVDFNSILSEMEQVMRMQGFSVGVLKAPESLMPENLVVGPNNILRLTSDVETNGEVDFSYASPNSDIPGSISLAEFILASFLSSRGLDPSTVSGRPQAQKSSSGVERLLSMIQKFEATKEDFSLYECVEDDIYSIVKAWHNVSIGTSTLEPKYISSKISEDSNVSVVYHRPEMIQTKKEQIELIAIRKEEGLISKIDAIMELDNLNREDAIGKSVV